MKLEQSDAELFYQLWFPLLDFVNRKHHVCPETETIGQRKGIDARNAKKTLGCLLLYAARFDAYCQPPWTHISCMEPHPRRRRSQARGTVPRRTPTALRERGVWGERGFSQRSRLSPQNLSYLLILLQI